MFRILPNLPPPPQSLVERIDRSFRPEQRLFNPADDRHLRLEESGDWRRQRYDWIQPMASNRNMRRQFESDWLAWVRENVTTEFQEANSGIMFFDEPQLPHTDFTRDFVLLYNIDVGGNDAKLCFWQEREHPVHRERSLAVPRGSHLLLLDSVSGPWNVWYLMNTRVLHSVESQSGQRLNIQVSFDTQVPMALQGQFSATTAGRNCVE